MKKTNENKGSSEKKLFKKNMGFYIALGICIVTIAAAAWTTYGSVLEYQDDGTDGRESSGVEAAGEVSGESYERSVPTDDTSGTENSIVDNSSTNEREGQKTDPDPEASVDETSVEEPSESVVFPVADTKAMKEFSIKDPVFSRTTNDWRTHGGVDFRASKGTAVRAVSGGTVNAVGKDPMYGNYIVISNDKFTARYCGLTDSSVVSEGDNVETGSTIGYIGIVPCEVLDEDHIHIEVTVNGTVVDPMVILKNPHK